MFPTMRQTPWRREISCFSCTTLPRDAGSASATILRQTWCQAPTQERNNDDSDEEWKPNTPNRWWGGGAGVDNRVGESVPLTAEALRHLPIGPPHRRAGKRKRKSITSPTKRPHIRQIQGVLQQRCNGTRVCPRNKHSSISQRYRKGRKWVWPLINRLDKSSSTSVAKSTFF